MRNIILNSLLFVSSLGISQSNYVDLKNNIKYISETSNKEPDIILIGLDTMTFDTIFFYKDSIVRLAENRVVLEKIYLSKCQGVLCAGHGFVVSGVYIKYFKNGKIAEKGILSCNFKDGEWIYNYENGLIKRFENYNATKLMDSYMNPFLSGVYKEYHINKKVKLSGQYRVVQKWSSEPIFNFDTFTEEFKCCNWVTTSVKYGIWKEYDINGNLIKIESFDIDLDNNNAYRDLPDSLND